MNANATIETPLQKAIRIAGGQSALGRAIGKTQSTVHSWLARSGRVPAEHVFAVANATGMAVAELRPDLVESQPARDPLGQPSPASPTSAGGGPTPALDTALAGVRS